MQNTLENNREQLLGLCDEELVTVWNEYCSDYSIMDDYIYSNDEDTLDEILASYSPSEVARTIFFGDYNYSDDYVKFNGYANLETTSYPQDWIYIDDMVEWAQEQNYFDLDEEEDEDEE